MLSLTFDFPCVGEKRIFPLWAKTISYPVVSQFHDSEACIYEGFGEKMFRMNAHFPWTGKLNELWSSLPHKTAVKVSFIRTRTSRDVLAGKPA